jgi:hypothetical protein
LKRATVASHLYLRWGHFFKLVFSVDGKLKSLFIAWAHKNLRRSARCNINKVFFYLPVICINKTAFIVTWKFLRKLKRAISIRQ